MKSARSLEGCDGGPVLQLMYTISTFKSPGVSVIKSAGFICWLVKLLLCANLSNTTGKSYSLSFILPSNILINTFDPNKHLHKLMNECRSLFGRPDRHNIYACSCKESRTSHFVHPQTLNHTLNLDCEYANSFIDAFTEW